MTQQRLTPHPHLSPLIRTSHLSPLTSHPHLSPLTSHLSPLTSHLSPLTLTLTQVHAMSQQRLHIAINLNGHHWNSASESVRFGLFGRQAAPITAAYMGYPGPCGASTIQYTYVDGWVAPPATHAIHYTERLALLPHTYYLNDYAAAHAQIARTAVQPSADGLSRACAFFCSLNQLPSS